MSRDAPPALITLDADRLRSRLPYSRVIECLRVAFAEVDLGSESPRSSVALDRGSLLMMPFASGRWAGVKLVTAAAEGDLPHIQGLLVVFSQETLAPVALLDGAELTAIRTAGVSALATDLLAARIPSRLVIFGSGVQAHAHLESMCAVREIVAVDIISRSGPSDSLLELAESLGVPAAAATPDAVAAADLVCTCTTSSQPLFDGDLLRPGAHVNAVGSYTSDVRELDGACIEGSDVFVENRDTAEAEIGEIVLAREEGRLGPAGVFSLADLVATGRARSSRNRSTVFKSVGLAFEDIAVAQAALEEE